MSVSEEASLHLNGKVERSYLTDQTEFYQLIRYVDIEIQRRLTEWEIIYKMCRLNGALRDQTPYKVLKEKPARYS